MKIFRIAFASFLAAASLNAISNPAMAKQKSPSSIKPQTTHVAEEYSYDYEEEYTDKTQDDDSYDDKPYDNKSYDHKSYEDKSYDDTSEYDYDHKEYSKPQIKNGKYKVDVKDHQNHTNKNMCPETELDHMGGKVGWHTDKHDPTPYDDKDDQEHCGYYFPNETGDSVINHTPEDECPKDKWSKTKKHDYSKGQYHKK